MAARSHKGSQVRVADASRLGESNERTDGRTDAASNTDCAIPELSDARPRVQADVNGVVSLTDVLKAGFLPTADRFPVIRSGQRAEIPWHVRAAVWYRDGGTCQKCRYVNPRPWHLDHITPWSAGGADTTDNLRVLCEPCNVERSNFDDRTSFPKRPVTWWCHRCYGPEQSWTYGDHTIWNGLVEKHIGVRCGQYEFHNRCRVQGLYLMQVQSGREPATWHQREPVEAADLIAYCAHCGTVGMTDVTL